MLLYLHHCNSNVFFHPAKFDNFKDEISDYRTVSVDKSKTCWTENCWSSVIMSNFRGQFFYVLRGRIKKKIENIIASALNIKMKLRKCDF